MNSENTSDKNFGDKKEINLKVSGMHCAMCAAGLEATLKKARGIYSASVDIASERADIFYNEDETDIRDIEKLINSAGYRIIKSEIKIKISGMHCAVCAEKTKNELLKIPGIISADINLIDNSAFITFIKENVKLLDIKAAIEKAGFEYMGTDEEVSTDSENQIFLKEQKERIKKIIIGLFISGVLIALMFFGQSLPLNFPVSYLMFIITTPVFLYLGYPIFKAAFKALLNHSLTMDVMYAMGIGVSYLSSVFGTFGIILTNDFMFYETSVMLATFLTLGRFLEAKAKGKTNDAVKKLIELRPKTAFVKRNGEFVEVSADELLTDEEIMVKPGGRVPVDGLVISGEGYIDESAITGESLPVRKSKGDSVVGGTLNTADSFVFRSTKVGRETVISQIIRLVEETQRQKPPVQRLADTAVSWFIPVILAIALIASFSWYFILGSSSLFALTVFISIIVVACPCALGLATPTAVTVGIGRGAGLGILIKNGESLEVSKKLKCIIFDKTGTLTVGKPFVTSVKSYKTSHDELLAIASGVEISSEHPIAKAIVKKAEDEGIKPLPLLSFKSFAGGGVSAEYEGKKVLIGNQDFILKSGLLIPDNAKEELSDYQNSGETAVLVALDNEITGIISVSDVLKRSAPVCVEEIKKMGLSVAMVTGDNEKTARHIAQKAGISDVYAGVLPDKKADIVKRIQETTGPCSFVGDGINDAPALAKSDVGIAVGSGTEIAIESADIVLMHDNLLDVPAAVQLSKKVMGRIRLNLFWAFAYNTALVPIAAGILYPGFGIIFRPEYAGFAMILSSVTVISLSLLLKTYTPPAISKES